MMIYAYNIKLIFYEWSWRIISDNYEIWTTDEVMDYLLVGRNTLYNLLRKGKIKGFKIGSCWKIPKKAVDNYIASESGINT